MFKPTVRRIAVVAVAAPALVIATAVAAAASENHAADHHSQMTQGHSPTAWYHQTGATANAWGASTSRTDAMVGGRNGHGYVWSDQSRATANAWGADAGRTTSFATNGWGPQNGGNGAGFSASAAHAGADGASAGDVDAGAFEH
jgi:hypothetical protein